MEFMLVFDWVDEDDINYKYETYIETYRTKEELLEAKKKAEEEFDWQVKIGRLILSPAIGYSWADFEQLF